MDLGIEGRTALVMAASRGIGRGIAAALAREGARVAISSRSEEALRAAAEEIDGEVRTFPADTDDLERMRELPGEVAEALGPIEILVANTGGPPGGGALDNSLEEWEAAFRSLVLAPRGADRSRCCPGCASGAGAGSSTSPPARSASRFPGLALSNANRMAALGLLKTLADEVAGDGITVNTVATGMFATDRLADRHGSLEQAEAAARTSGFRPRRLGTPEEYGDLVAFLCSERAAYLTGAVIPLDGGLLRSV